MASDQSPRREKRLAAATAGRTKFLGRPCPKCDSEVRYTSSGQCVACTFDRAAKHANAIRDALKAAREE